MTNTNTLRAFINRQTERSDEQVADAQNALDVLKRENYRLALVNTVLNEDMPKNARITILTWDTDANLDDTFDAALSELILENGEREDLSGMGAMAVGYFDDMDEPHTYWDDFMQDGDILTDKVYEFAEQRFSGSL